MGHRKCGGGQRLKVYIRSCFTVVNLHDLRSICHVLTQCIKSEGATWDRPNSGGHGPYTLPHKNATAYKDETHLVTGERLVVQKKRRGRPPAFELPRYISGHGRQS